MDKPVIWAEMSVDAIREYLKKKPTVILPLGCTEQHGYHLPTKVDILNAEEIGKRVSAETDVAMLPTVNYSYSGGELPGTINVSPGVVALYVEEICLSLAAQGVKNIVALLGHGGSENNAALQAFRDMFLRKYKHLDITLAVIPLFVMNDDGDVVQFLGGNDVEPLFDKGDWHAGKTETSLMLYWAPELVQMGKIQHDSGGLAELMRENPDAYQEVQRPIDLPYIAPRISQRAEIEVGVMGYPERATAEIGEQMALSCVKEVVRIIQQIEALAR